MLRRLAVGLLVAAALLWLGGAAVLYALQRSILFPAPTPARDVSLEDGELLRIPVPNGAPDAVAFHLPAQRAEAPTVVFFHGNGEQLADGLWLAEALRREEGVGFFGVEYPGYGLAAGEPGEEAILQAARAAVGHLVKERGVPKERLVLFGQSLGSGAATALAHEGWGTRLALATPFTSVTDAAAHHIPWLPVRRLVRDRFDSLSRAAEVRVPVFIVHGTQDGVVPYAHGERLSKAFPRARLVTVEGGGHNDLYERAGVREALFAFLAGRED